MHLVCNRINLELVQYSVTPCFHNFMRLQNITFGMVPGLCEAVHVIQGSIVLVIPVPRFLTDDIRLPFWRNDRRWERSVSFDPRGGRVSPRQPGFYSYTEGATWKILDLLTETLLILF